MLHPFSYNGTLPDKFTYPHCYQPHPAAVMAAEIVQKYLSEKEEWKEELQKGKMFGVLIVSKKTITTYGENDAFEELPLFFLAAYSGLLNGRNDHDFFVPPVFNSQGYDGHFKTEERRISALSRAGRTTRQYSINLQRWLFSQYNVLNGVGEQKNVLDIFREYYSGSKAYEKKANGVPPSGTGDCCAPKLLQYAYIHDLKPVCMAEFWYGDSPKGEIRHHLQYYPACSGKCKPLLGHMLKGLDVEQNPQEKAIRGKLKVLYEDEFLIAVDKPAGMPSVPGKLDLPDVVTVLRKTHHSLQDPGLPLLPVHRLDMATSGLLLIAKDESVYKQMQSMFARREVDKEYIAKLTALPSEKEGVISLPLSPDFMNRPYQKVDHEKGKEAVTEYKWLESSLYSLKPITGRTHQLRVHCAHPDGLNSPILGDELYGTSAARLYLHCQRMEFVHPIDNREIELFSPAPF